MQGAPLVSAHILHTSLLIVSVLFLVWASLLPTPGPLHLLFHVPEVLFLLAASLSPFSSQLRSSDRSALISSMLPSHLSAFYNLLFFPGFLAYLFYLYFRIQVPWE